MQYVKIPTYIYSNKEYMKYQRSLNQQDSQDRDPELDKCGHYDNQEDSDDMPPEGLVVWERVPLEDLVGCSYQPISSNGNLVKEGITDISIVFCRDGSAIETAWHIDELEDFLIDFGIVSPQIRKQKESFSASV